MTVLEKLKSDELRQLYIKKFVNTDLSYYIDKIEKKTEFSDGLCYVGYLWDCIRNPKVITETETQQILKDKKNIFIMWDIHSCDRILIPNYWKYPKSSILFAKEWSTEMNQELPKDVYVFDNSFTLSVIYTHETDMNGKRYCIYLEEKAGDD